MGILHLLDDESNFPRASDASFLEKCHYNHALNELYSRPRLGASEFGVRNFTSFMLNLRTFLLAKFVCICVWTGTIRSTISVEVDLDRGIKLDDNIIPW